MTDIPTPQGDIITIRRLDPLATWVLVLPERRRPLKSGLHLAGNTAATNVGLCVAVSPTVARRTPELVVGSRVVFKPFAGSDLAWSGWRMKLLQHAEILALIDEDADCQS